ncbi:hypothetical protein [Nocardia sp. NBC_00416]|uniref:hypothetical protein n=1 Tax=Nocardia sp. NBC_00416 TaxID=2975991 RepID=UPI002E1E3997
MINPIRADMDDKETGTNMNKVKLIIAASGILSASFLPILTATPAATADPVPTPLSCKGNPTGAKSMEVRCFNLSATNHYRVRVSIDCGFWPDPDTTFYIPPNDDRRETLECGPTGDARGTFKWEVIQ